MRARRLGKYACTTPAFLLLLPLLALVAQAQMPITSCGTVIDTPGQYYLANNLNCHSGDAAITIVSANVELDLDNHHINGPGAESRTGGIWVRDSVAGNVLLLGPGVIRNMVVGVRISSTGQAMFSQLTCTGNGNGIVADSSVTVTARSNNASHNRFSGILVSGSDGEIGGNTTIGNGHSGMIIGGSRNRIDHTNVASHNRMRGIEVFGQDNVIDHNTAERNGEYDLFERHDTCENLWENNTFGRANLSCIH